MKLYCLVEHKLVMTASLCCPHSNVAQLVEQFLLLCKEWKLLHLLSTIILLYCSPFLLRRLYNLQDSTKITAVAIAKRVASNAVNPINTSQYVSSSFPFPDKLSSSIPSI